MIGAYLIVGGVVVMVASYIAIMHGILSRVERRDLAALGHVQSKQAPPKAKAIAAQVPNALPAPA